MKNDINKIIKVLHDTYGIFDFPKRHRNDPFMILISCILSQRTTDEIMIPTTENLFKYVSTPEEMIKLGIPKLERLIRSTGFFRQKAKNIINSCKALVKYHGSKVPDDIDKLLELPGVGRKTANIVLSQGYNQNAIAVDIHVHRISNRLGWVKTDDPEKTEFALYDILPEKKWIHVNEWLVKHGQQICRPITPFCSKCGIEKYCPKIGVNKSH